MSNPTPPAEAPAIPASGVNEPWAKSWIQPDFKLDHKALDRLPDHLKGMRPTLEKYGTFEDVLTGYQNQQVMAGKKALGPLMPDAPKEAIAERKALMDTLHGVPKEMKDYGIAKPKDLPDEAWNPKLAETFTTWAHENSVSPASAKKLIELVGAETMGQLAQQQQYQQTYWANEQKAFDATIQRENIPSDKANALVEKGAIALGLDLTSERTKTFLKGSDARLMAMRHAVAIGEDTVVTGDAKAGEGNNHADMANDVIRNAANPLHEQYWNRDGKFSADQAAAARAKVQGWLKLDAEKRAKGGR